MLNHFLYGSWVSGWSDVGPLVLRAALGIIFIWHGWDKVTTVGLGNVAGFLGSIGLPVPDIMAQILAYGEILSGILLVVGLFTYLAAKFALVVGVVAFFLVHLKNGFSIAGGGYEFIMLITAAAISLLVTGAGKYSLDAMWWKKEQGRLF